MKKMVFGLGTGRCGTVSLTALLNLQKGFKAEHEKLITPWEVNYDYMNRTIRIIQAYEAEVVCDVSFWHLPYVDYIMTKFSGVKFVCLKRDKEVTVKSYDKKTGYNPVNGLGERNHWTARNSIHWIEDKWRLDPVYDKCYPKYDLPRLEGIAQYWEDYYAMAEVMVNSYPKNFRIYDSLEVLNDAEVQRHMLDFIGVSISDMVIETNIKKNRGK